MSGPVWELSCDTIAANAATAAFAFDSGGWTVHHRSIDLLGGRISQFLEILM